MKLIVLLAAVCIALTPAPAAEGGISKKKSNEQPNAVLSTMDCNDTWRRASPNNSDLSPEQAQSYVAEFEVLDHDRNGFISISEFKAGCEKGLVRRGESQPDDRGKTD